MASIDPVIAIDLLTYSNSLGLYGLQQKCELVISKLLDAENAAGLLELTDRLRCTQLRSHCVFFLRNNMETVSNVLKERLDDFLPKELQDEVKKNVPGSVTEYKHVFQWSDIASARDKLEALLHRKN